MDEGKLSEEAEEDFETTMILSSLLGGVDERHV